MNQEIKAKAQDLYDRYPNIKNATYLPREVKIGYILAVSQIDGEIPSHLTLAEVYEIFTKIIPE